MVGGNGVSQGFVFSYGDSSGAAGTATSSGPCSLGHLGQEEMHATGFWLVQLKAFIFPPFDN